MSEDEEGPDRPVPARRRAEQRWRMSEPWRLRERRRRRLKIGGIAALVVAVALVLALRSPGAPVSARDAIAVAGTGGSYRFLFYGCHGERLVDLTVFAGDPPASASLFTTGALWLVQAEGKGTTGSLQIDLGTTPSGFRTVVPFRGLPASAPHFTVVAQTSAQRIQFRFDRSLVAGDTVITATGRYPLQTYQHDEASVCSS